MTDYYTLLGVSRGATTREITVAYRRLAAKYHPDHHEGNALQPLAEEKLKALNEAHQVLSKPNLRAQYDAALAGRPPMPDAMHGPGSAPPPTLARIVMRWITLGMLLLVAVRLFRDPRLLFVLVAGWVAWRVVKGRSQR
jgi:curved DNA-binding protein CbpA